MSSEPLRGRLDSLLGPLPAPGASASSTQPQDAVVRQLLIDAEEDVYLRAVLVGMLGELRDELAARLTVRETRGGLG